MLNETAETTGMMPRDMKIRPFSAQGCVFFVGMGFAKFTSK
ncbi:hypothetical protein [Rubinisphaera sp.]|nr:hypothetical protein [Rubinisphaera sp.]|tara:strand:- start:505 stop:627 length:123 start_codon:yes stop_codon:yes gene_type:complete